MDVPGETFSQSRSSPHREPTQKPILTRKTEVRATVMAKRSHSLGTAREMK
jgi:hypothetical protein